MYPPDVRITLLAKYDFLFTQIYLAIKHDLHYTMIEKNAVSRMTCLDAGSTEVEQESTFLFFFFFFTYHKSTSIEIWKQRRTPAKKAISCKGCRNSCNNYSLITMDGNREAWGLESLTAFGFIGLHSLMTCWSWQICKQKKKRDCKCQKQLIFYKNQ